MAARPELVRYLHDCFVADHRSGGVTDLFAARISHRRFLTGGEELIGAALQPVGVDAAAFDAIALAALLAPRELALLYCAFPLVGAAAPGTDGRRPRLCAPLLLFPAQLGRVEGFPEALLGLSIDRGDGRVNLAGLEAVFGDAGAAAAAGDVLTRELGLDAGALPRDPESYRRLPELLRAAGVPVAGDDLGRWPALAGEEEVERALRAARRDRRLCCLPACALALVPRSFEVRGIVHGLTELAAAPRRSAPLERLLGGPGPAGRFGTPDDPDDPEEDRRGRGAARRGAEPSAVPAVLSAAQTKALDAARGAELTVIVGPPGTGKSFTLAAIALDHLARGRSVLFAARTDAALAVLAEKIEAILGLRDIVLRAGRRDFLRDLKRRLAQLLGRAASPAGPAPDAHLKRQAAAGQALERAERALRRRADLEVRWGAAAREDPTLGAWGRWRRRLAERSLRRRLAGGPAHWRLAEEYEIRLTERTDLAGSWLRESFRLRLEERLAADRPAFRRFLGALRARHSSRQRELHSEIDFGVLLGAFPIWMVAFADAERVLPLERHLFDLVIVDEATQCDLASALPAIQRGRHLVITGDPEQLRHVSFLARERQRALGDKHGLSAAEVETFDYRGRSLLDRASELALDGGETVFLDEHFRSAPAIIRFSNRAFYRGALRVMTRRPETEDSRSLRLHRVAGKREPEGHNPAEAKALVDVLWALYEDEALLPRGLCRSVGVLSPFRRQVEHLGERIATLPGPVAERHGLLLGTPYAFQGQERDVMLISWALDPESAGGAFRYLDRSDVFNVAITRARSVQHVFCSLDPHHAPAGHLLRRYLEDVQAGEVPERPAPASDLFVRDVAAALERHGLRSWPSYTVAGFTVDLVVSDGRSSLGIDLVGHPGAFADALDLERCRMLMRAGLPDFPLPLSAWRRDREGAVATILDRMAPALGET